MGKHERKGLAGSEAGRERLILLSSGSVGGLCMTTNRIGIRSFRLIGFAALVVAMSLAGPRVAGAVNVCNGAFQITYPVGANFPQPVPPGNAGDDTLTVQLDLGAGAITGGVNNRLTVTDVRFDLDCSDASPTCWAVPR